MPPSIPVSCEVTFFHILWFLHSENNDVPNMSRDDYDRLWKLRRGFEYFNAIFAEVCYLTEHLVMEEIIIKYKGKAVFCQFIPKERKRFSMKLCKLCDLLKYSYDIKV
jgi:hypothetical protein